MHFPIKLNRHRAQAARWSLHYGTNARALTTVVPDAVYPDMWRILWPDGRVSDLGNLTRIRDAALDIAQRGPPRRYEKLFRWQKMAWARDAERNSPSACRVGSVSNSEGSPPSLPRPGLTQSRRPA
jgi:hypothetical protein